MKPTPEQAEIIKQGEEANDACKQTLRALVPRKYINPNECNELVPDDVLEAEYRAIEKIDIGSLEEKAMLNTHRACDIMRQAMNCNRLDMRLKGANGSIALFTKLYQSKFDEMLKAANTIEKESKKKKLINEIQEMKRKHNND